MTTDGETPGCVRCVSMLGMRGSLWSHGSNRCKHFSLQRALYAGVLEACGTSSNHNAFHEFVALESHHETKNKVSTKKASDDV